MVVSVRLGGLSVRMARIWLVCDAVSTLNQRCEAYQLSSSLDYCVHRNDTFDLWSVRPFCMPEGMEAE